MGIIKTINLNLLAVVGLSACAQSEDALQIENTPALSEKNPTVKTSKNSMPVFYDGKYTMGGPCDVLEGTMTISDKSIRISETLCKVTDEIALGGSAKSYSLSNCLTEGSKEDDRKIIVEQTKGIDIEVTGWAEDVLIFNVCK